MADCVHHWVLPAPSAATVPGECRKCGATREFDTGFHGADWAGNTGFRQRGALTEQDTAP